MTERELALEAWASETTATRLFTLRLLNCMGSLSFYFSLYPFPSNSLFLLSFSISITLVIHSLSSFPNTLTHTHTHTHTHTYINTYTNKLSQLCWDLHR